MQLGSDQVHGFPPYVVHHVDVKLAKLTSVLVSRRETLIGLFDALEKGHVQRRVWSAELDDKLPTFNGVAGSALACCWSDGLACYSLRHVVTLLLRDGSVLLKKPLCLVMRQR